MIYVGYVIQVTFILLLRLLITLILLGKLPLHHNFVEVELIEKFVLQRCRLHVLLVDIKLRKPLPRLRNIPDQLLRLLPIILQSRLEQHPGARWCQESRILVSHVL